MTGLGVAQGRAGRRGQVQRRLADRVAKPSPYWLGQIGACSPRPRCG